MNTATTAWLTHLDAAMQRKSELQNFDVAGVSTRGVVAQEVSVADHSTTTPVAQSQYLPINYLALADEAAYGLVGGSDLADLLESSPRMGRWAREVRSGRGPGSIGHIVSAQAKAVALGILDGATEYHENDIACGTIGLTNLSFATYHYSKKPMLGCRAVFKNLDLVKDLPYELFNVAILAWHVAVLLNTRVEDKYCLGYCRTVSMDGFVEQADMDNVERALNSVPHETASCMSGTAVDPTVGGAATQKQAMALALDACRRGVYSVAPNFWDIRAGWVDAETFPGNI